MTVSMLEICIIAGIAWGFGLSAGLFVASLLICKLRDEVRHSQSEE